MVENRVTKKTLKYIVLMSLTLIIIIGYSSGVVYAAGNGSNSQIEDDEIMSMFDPFMLNTISLTTDNVVLSRPPIRINCRPVVRSYFRPPLVPLDIS